MNKKEKQRIKRIKRNQKNAKKQGKAQPPDTSPEGTVATHDAADITQDEVHIGYGKLNWAEADIAEANLSDTLEDGRALQFLSRAAEALDDVIQYARETIKRVAPEQVAEALDIIEESRGPSTDNSKARRGPNRVVQLMNVMLRAEGLLLRLTKVTNPSLHKLKRV
jgi:hypothetical protein